jgi:hypothetical protein
VVPVAEDMLEMVESWMKEWHFAKPQIVLAGNSRHR